MYNREKRKLVCKRICRLLHQIRYNSPNTEKISNIIDSTYNKHVTIYENIKHKIKLQIDAYNDCYKNNNKKFDWLFTIF